MRCPGSGELEKEEEEDGVEYDIPCLSSCLLGSDGPCLRVAGGLGKAALFEDGYDASDV